MSGKAYGGDVDYAQHGLTYGKVRRPDPRIAAQIHASLGSAKTVLNVGAGAGSYEPADRYVAAVEPSETMRAQRAEELAVAVRAFAEDLPFDDASFDAVMATVTLHQWSDWKKGVAEMKRVAKKRIVIMAFDPEVVPSFWLFNYAPGLIRTEVGRYQTPKDIVAELGGSCRVDHVLIPLDCSDGFTEAFYGRPEKFLQAEVRAAQSSWTFIGRDEEDKAVQQLSQDIESGTWDNRYGALRKQPQYDGSLRLIVCEKSQ